tara:strand:- start:894 stop:1373 length:480 start_codon:yes stop_codon:yes gene_type:complete
METENISVIVDTSSLRTFILQVVNREVLRPTLFDGDDLDDRITNAVESAVSNEDIAQNIDLKRLARNVDCREIADNIDGSEVAQHLDHNDIAGAIDLDDLANHIDLADLAGEVGGDAAFLDNVAEKIDYKSLARALLDEINIRSIRHMPVNNPIKAVEP